jgi:hypothetical protein
MATYYVRNDGSAANKAAGTGPSSDSSACMSIATFNGETFADNDIIIFSSLGGALTTAIVIPSGGSGVGSEIEYKGESGNEPTITATGGFDNNSLGNLIIRDFTFNNAAGTTGFHFDGNVSNITTHDLTVTDVGNQGFQHLDAVSVTHNNVTLTCSSGDECFSMHNTPTVVVNGGTLTANNNLSCVNYVNIPTATFNDVTFNANGATSYTVEVAGTGTFSFNRCTFVEDVTQNSRVMDWVSGCSVEYINCIFLNLTDADYYVLARSGVTKFDVINCTFKGDGVNSCTAIFNQDADFKCKNTAFEDVLTEALWSATGTIDHCLFWNSGTARGTNQVTSDPAFGADGKIQSIASGAYDVGIGPGSDADIPTDDIDGDSRSGATCDIGADEFDSSLIPIITHHRRQQRRR